jgi:hypothetical protein
VIFHNSPILDDAEIMDFVVTTYIGLFSSGGKEPEDKFGNIPLKKERTGIAWAVNTDQNVRLVIAVVPTTDVTETMKMVTTNAAQTLLDNLKNNLSVGKIDRVVLERNVVQLGRELTIVDEVSRISNVFGDEI